MHKYVLYVLFNFMDHNTNKGLIKVSPKKIYKHECHKQYHVN